MSGITRRRFLRDAAAGATIIGAAGVERLVRAQSVLPDPVASGIEHIVVVMMENRSFDHYLGWLSGADGRQADLSYIDRTGAAQSTHPLAPDFQGCGHPDPDHSAAGGRIELNGGACDGWLLAGDNDEYAIGYYTQSDLSFFGKAAPYWTTCDRYFSAIMAETFPNRFYQHCAQTDRLHNSFDLSSLPTIWDRLAERGISARYYFSDAPFLALWGAKYLPISRPLSAFLTDCVRGTLPHVSFVEPRFIEESTGISNDDHPHADIRDGQAFLNRVYEAVVRSPNWKETVLVINYDEWGGFFEHVPPPTAPIPPADQAAGNLDGLLGFRVPCLIVSSLARRGHVAHGVYDHTSILKMIEWRWNLEPLTVRDTTANNLAEALDFTAKTRRALFKVPDGPFAEFCPPTDVDKWSVLLDLARGTWGWPI